MVAPYGMNLSSKASLADNIKYCLFKIINVVKAIFNQSDWQCAKRQLLEGPFVQCMLDSVKDSLGDDTKFKLFSEMIEKEAEFLLYLSIDKKANNADDAQNALYIENCLSHIGNTFNDFFRVLLNDILDDLLDSMPDDFQNDIDLFKDDLKAIVDHFTFTSPSYEQNIAEITTLLPRMMPLIMRITTEYDVQAEMEEILTGVNVDNAVRSILTKITPDDISTRIKPYIKAKIEPYITTRIVPSIKEVQRRILEQAETDGMIDAITIEAAKQRNAAENEFLDQL
jgi:hypothetical protein